MRTHKEKHKKERLCFEESSKFPDPELSECNKVVILPHK